MEMMSCPHCGARNSSKRDVCFQCEGELRGGPKPKEQPGYVPKCASCSLAAIYAPAGMMRLASNEVWCTKDERPVSAEMVAGSCFSEAFGWRREEILD